MHAKHNPEAASKTENGSPTMRKDIAKHTGMPTPIRSPGISKRLCRNCSGTFTPATRGQNCCSSLCRIQLRTFGCDASTPQRRSGWAEIKPSDFGPEWDYELENHITRWIITPVSTAALEWCYAHLPEHLPRWGAKGFVIEAKHLNSIVKSMTRDGLMSAEEYERAMEEANMLQLQGDPE